MMKNSNKKAGDWGALKNKPQNQIYFKDGGKVKVTAGGEKHVIYKKTTKRGEGKVGNVMVNHPTKDKGVWDTIDLTKKSGAKTIKQGIASTKKWHKENPYNDMKKQVTKKQMGGPSQKTKTVNKNGSYRTVEKTKSTPSSFKQSSKTTRTGYGILKGAPKYKNILPAPITPTEPSSDGQYMQKGGRIKRKDYRQVSGKPKRISLRGAAWTVKDGIKDAAKGIKEAVKNGAFKTEIALDKMKWNRDVRKIKRDLKKNPPAPNDKPTERNVPLEGGRKNGGSVKKYQTGGRVTDSRTKKGLADGKMSKSPLDYSAREIAEGIYNTEKTNAQRAYNTVKGAAESYYDKAKTNAGKEYDDLKQVWDGIYNEGARKAGYLGDAFDAGYNFLFKKKGGSVKKYQTGGKVTPPTGKNALKTGVYKGGKKFTPADAKSMQQDWNKKERAATNPKNKPAGSPMRKLQNGGTADSTKYFYNKSMKELLNSNEILKKEGAYSKNFQEADKAATKSSADYLRQIRKGRSGYDKNGYPLRTPAPVTPKGVANAVTKAGKRTVQAISKKKK